jgi:hypothetical protein
VPEVTGDGLVQVAYLHSNEVSYSWHESMRRLVEHDRAAFGRIAGTKGPLNLRCSTGQLVLKRNYAVRLFLDGTPHEWLWMVDTDMGFQPDVVERLIEAAHPIERPVVGALCFAMQDAAYDDMGGMRCKLVPTIYRLGHTKDGHASFCHFGDYPANTMIQVAATGAACILLHRSVLEKVRAEHGDHWFDQMYNEDGQMVGEDFSLCVRLNAAGIPIFVHSGIKTTHHKDLWLGEEDYVQQADPPPPATDEVAVIVPVMKRPWQAAPFMASLRASTGLANVYAIADQDDQRTIEAWQEAGAVVLVWPGSAGTFAEKVNYGYRRTNYPHRRAGGNEPWIFIVGDDARFNGDWLDQAQHTARLTGNVAKVIGTNDLGNPRVISGEHATHLLIDRDYIDEHGASWDGPGIVAHEGYKHWYVDDEIVYASKQRGVWAMASQSIVPHLHPAWGKASTDEVYELGQSHAEEDGKTFEARCRRYLMQQEAVDA